MAQATDDLLALEERPADRERLDGAFRAVHTLKGAAGIVEFTAMSLALHAAEEVLSQVRTGAGAVTSGLISDCLTCLDQVVQWLDAMQESGTPPADAQAAADALIARFAAFGASGPGPAPAATGDAPAPELQPTAQHVLQAQIALLDDPTAEPGWGRTASAARVAANVLRHAGRVEAAEALARAGAEGDAGALRSALERLLAGGDAARGDRGAATEPAEPAALRAVRVDVERIDALVSLTGELTVAKGALGHAAALARDGADGPALAAMLKAQHARLDRLVGELQHAVLHMRVLPLRQVFQRFPRLVREMVLSLDKPARLVTQGDATEADKAIVEALFEPLLHVMRNALDHGVEPSAVRAAAGKPPSATIRLAASREGDRVVVEVEDDGAGIDPARVRAAALARGVVRPEAVEGLSDPELLELIFAPGFSTAPAVSQLSGRGVGMDAVRTAVERLGGRVSVQSVLGQGTTVRFVLPFTVMMSRVMTVEAAGQLFGIPMDAVVETLRIERSAIVPIGAAQAFVLRDRTIPLVDLGAVLGVTRTPPGPEARVVIAAAAGALVGLEVDRLGEPLDVMLKPMDGLLAATRGVAGTTLLGDGRVLIVLDLAALLA